MPLNNQKLNDLNFRRHCLLREINELDKESNSSNKTIQIDISNRKKELEDLNGLIEEERKILKEGKNMPEDSLKQEKPWDKLSKAEKNAVKDKIVKYMETTGYDNKTLRSVASRVHGHFTKLIKKTQ